MKHPNAAVAVGGTSLSTFIVWLLGHFHVSLSAEDGSVIAGGLAAIVLFIGRNGIKGAWDRIWNGGEKGATIIELLIVAIVVAIVVLFVKVY